MLMSEDKDSSLPTALVQIKDVLGLSAPLKRLVEAIVHGVGRWAYPIELRRNTTAEIETFRQWNKAITESGLSIGNVDLTLQERAALRVTAQEIRRQEHREAIAAQAVAAVRANPGEFNGSDDPLDPDWLDRFWRLAEDVSDANFQSIWARILARHAAGGTCYSARCLMILSALSRTEAEVLERLAPVAVRVVLEGTDTLPCVVHRIGDHIFGAGGKPSDQKTLRIQHQVLDEEVLPFRQELLGPIGIYVENGWAHEPYMSVINGAAELTIAGRRFKIDGFAQPPQQSALAMKSAIRFGGGIQFSLAGAEILSLIRTELNPKFVTAVGEIMKLYGLRLIQLDAV